MRVGINATWLGPNSGGIGVYVRNLARVLPILDARSHYLLYSQTPLSDAALGGIPRNRVLPSGAAGAPRRLPFGTSLALARARVQVAHEQITAPYIYPSRSVVTIHDTLHEQHPEFYTADVLSRMRAQTPMTIKRAAVILTDSHFSRHEIIRLYNAPPEKVVVAYLAPDPMYQPLQDAARLAAVRARYGTGERFLLFVGALKPNKNLKRVVEAYVRLRRADALRHRLVLVGPEAWDLTAVFAEARTSGYAGDIIFTGHVSDDDVVSLYNAAEVFVHPSLFEGFGLPPLEAMACGTPVITSNTTALPEVVGEAAVQVDPLDVEALAGALARVTGDAGLRAELRARGLQRAGQFTWEKTAGAVLDAYHFALRGVRP